MKLLWKGEVKNFNHQNYNSMSYIRCIIKEQIPSWLMLNLSSFKNVRKGHKSCCDCVGKIVA